jgi:hypothetical protein
MKTIEQALENDIPGAWLNYYHKGKDNECRVHTYMGKTEVMFREQTDEGLTSWYYPDETDVHILEAALIVLATATD